MTRYQNQSIADLNFYLLDTEILPGNIEVLQHKHLKQPHYQLDLRVVSTSHALSISTPFTALTEIVACSTIDNTHQPVLRVKRLHESGSEAVCRTNLRYSIDWEIQQFTPTDFMKRSRELHQRKHAGVYYEFPDELCGIEHPALTLIEYACQTKHIRVQTCHTYPNEFGIVTTLSQIELI